MTVGATSSIGMQAAINCIKEFCDKRKLRINIAQTKTVVFKRGRDFK
jgi:hypothetical protein